MFRDLLRLVPFVRKYKGRLLGGIVLFFIARLFEAAVPLCLMVGINRLTRGESDLLLPILGIVGAVVARFLVVSWARIAVRRAGFLVQYDLRHAFYKQLQRMGPTFYRQYAIGDLMTRAVADIQLIRRLIGNGTTMVVIFCFATLIGFSCMVFLSPTSNSLRPASSSHTALLHVAHISQAGSCFAAGAGKVVGSRFSCSRESIWNTYCSGDGVRTTGTR